MVRVISVYNFLKQEITSIDESVDAIAVPPNLLCLVQPNNTILVKNLTLISDVGYTIPTVDQAVKIVYSLQGNYIASLESKITRNGTKVSYVRVYLNWETLKETKDSYPMRARIAGRVTPLSQNQKGLEMIEIPNQFMPEYVSCCPVSGNLLISSRNILSIYTFETQVHDISKIHFIDFKQISVDLHISFTPKQHQIVENMIAAINEEYVHVFTIKSAVPLCSLSDKEFSIEDIDKIPTQHQQPIQKYQTINYEKLMNELEEIKLPFIADSFEEIQKRINELNISEENLELKKIHISSFPIKHEFPTIQLERSLSDLRGKEVFRQNPFTSVTDLVVSFTLKSNAGNQKVQYKAVDLCRYRLSPITLGSISSHEIQEKFSFLILKPFYSNEKSESEVKQQLFESEHYRNLKSVACFFGTQQEGYLQCFEYNFEAKEDIVTFNNYVTYSFTAPVLGIQLDESFAHVITDVGLETYTLRAAKHLLKTTDTMVCPPSSDPVCLIGLHPFVNVFRTCITKNYLNLFTNNEESSCTLYQLKLPDIKTVWKDFLASAEENKWEAPPTYCELLGEGHLILKTRLKTSQWFTRKDPSRNMLGYAFPSNQTEENKDIEMLYNESCALLGDYHILNKNYQMAYCYYLMSGHKILDNVKRIRGLWGTIPEIRKQNYNEKDITLALIHYLKKTLAFYDQKYYEFVGNREELYSSEIGNLVVILMDLLEKEDESAISDLVLESIVLREFSTDRILKILKSLISKSSAPQDKDALSLALMCLQRDQSEQAKTVLLTLKPHQLEALLLQYYDLLFANHSASGINMFTELSMILIEIYPNVLATVLSELVTGKRLLSLSKVLKIFMDIMPTGGFRAKNSSFVLQIFLENYFKFYIENFPSKKFNHKITEAMKILIRIYLTRLQEKNDKSDKMLEEESNSVILFYKWRSSYLAQVPPFGPDLNQMFEPQEENLSKASANKEEKTILLKMQSILSYDDLPDECLAEVRNFLSKQSNIFGALSLKILSAPTLQDAISLLVNFSPQPLVQFAKENVKEKNDWKFLVTQIHKRIGETIEDTRLKFYFQQILSDILHYIAENLNIEDLVDIIPKDYDDAERYFSLAQNNAQANHLKTLIMITGKQLLASM